jgi:hypothetical protein
MARRDWLKFPPRKTLLNSNFTYSEISLDILTTRSPDGLERLRDSFRSTVKASSRSSSVYNVDRATQLLRESFGEQPVYASMQPGADGTRVNFFLVAGADGKKYWSNYTNQSYPVVP